MMCWINLMEWKPQDNKWWYRVVSQPQPRTCSPFTVVQIVGCQHDGNHLSRRRHIGGPGSLAVGPAARVLEGLGGDLHCANRQQSDNQQFVHRHYVEFTCSTSTESASCHLIFLSLSLVKFHRINVWRLGKVARFISALPEIPCVGVDGIRAQHQMSNQIKIIGVILHVAAGAVEWVGLLCERELKQSTSKLDETLSRAPHTLRVRAIQSICIEIFGCRQCGILSCETLQLSSLWNPSLLCFAYYILTCVHMKIIRFAWSEGICESIFDFSRYRLISKNSSTQSSIKLRIVDVREKAREEHFLPRNAAGDRRA